MYLCRYWACFCSESVHCVSQVLQMGPTIKSAARRFELFRFHDDFWHKTPIHGRTRRWLVRWRGATSKVSACPERVLPIDRESFECFHSIISTPADCWVDCRLVVWTVTLFTVHATVHWQVQHTIITCTSKYGVKVYWQSSEIERKEIPVANTREKKGKSSSS